MACGLALAGGKGRRWTRPAVCQFPQPSPIQPYRAADAVIGASKSNRSKSSHASFHIVRESDRAAFRRFLSDRTFADERSASRARRCREMPRLVSGRVYADADGPVWSPAHRRSIEESVLGELGEPMPDIRCRICAVSVVSSVKAGEGCRRLG